MAGIEDGTERGPPRASPSLAALAEEWLDDRASSGRGMAPATEAAYRRDLTAWARAIAELLRRPRPDPVDAIPPAPFETELGRINLEDLSPENIRKAAGMLAREGYAPATRARMLAALRGLCRWLAGEGYLGLDPTMKHERPQLPGRLPGAFLASELDRIVATVSSPDSGARRPWPARDRALVAVLAGAGLRAAEVCGLAVGDFVTEHHSQLRVLGKGSKERRVPIASEVAEAVDGYLGERAARFGVPSPTDALFVKAGGEAISRQGLNYHVRRWLARAGVPKPPGEVAHAFRHTYAKGLVSRGVPLSAVQALLGHASLSTTQVYLRMTGAELVDAAQAAEVRDALRATGSAPVTPGRGATIC